MIPGFMPGNWAVPGVVKEVLVGIHWVGVSLSALGA